MATTTSPLYAGGGTTPTAITLTLTSLANFGGTFPASTGIRQSTVVDNTSTAYLDALVSIFLNTLGGTIANDATVYVYAYAIAADGTVYTGGASGTDSAYTMRNPTTLPLLGVIGTPDASVSYVGGPWSVALAFGGVLPAKWGVVVRNYCGQALAASGNLTYFQGINLTTA